MGSDVPDGKEDTEAAVMTDIHGKYRLISLGRSGDEYLRSAVDRVAARVVFSSGVHYEPNKKILTPDSDAPLPTRKIVRHIVTNAEFKDLSGERFGMFTVIGLSDKPGGYWVVRCDCGIYTLRKTKSVKNKNNQRDCCERCRHLLHIKERESWRRREGAKAAKKILKRL